MVIFEWVNKTCFLVNMCAVNSVEVYIHFSSIFVTLVFCIAYLWKHLSVLLMIKYIHYLIWPLVHLQQLTCNTEHFSFDFDYKKNPVIRNHLLFCLAKLHICSRMIQLESSNLSYWNRGSRILLAGSFTSAFSPITVMLCIYTRIAMLINHTTENWCSKIPLSVSSLEIRSLIFECNLFFSLSLQS